MNVKSIMPTNFNTNTVATKEPSKFTVADQLRSLRAINKNLKRKVRREARKVQELGRLKMENDQLQMDLIAISNGELPRSMFSKPPR